MKNGVVIYLEDNDDDGIMIVGRIIGNPVQSRELADDIMMDLVGSASIGDYISEALH